MSLTLKAIDEGIEAITANGADLVREAKVLLEIGAWPRAFALAHLAREEFARVIMLGAAAHRLLAGRTPDWKRLMARLRDHKSKLRQETVQNILLMQGLGHEGTSDFLCALPQIVERRNELKNASLYVNFSEGKFLRPADAVEERVARRTVELADMQLWQVRTVQEKMGPYAAKKVGALAHMPNLDDPKNQKEVFEKTAEMWVTVLQHLASESKNE